jgi:hypothetical protein
MSIPCFKTIIAKDIAEMYIQYIYRYYNAL